MSKNLFIVYALRLLIFDKGSNAFPDVDKWQEKGLRCSDMPETLRVDCGYGGITKEACVNRGCCFLPTYTSPIPWCFSLSKTVPYRSTTQPSDITTRSPLVSPSSKDTPNWLKQLLTITRKTSTSKKASVSTSAPLVSATINTLTDVIEDELLCQKTYRLYKKTKGVTDGTKCSTNLHDRIPCVQGNLTRSKGESECTVCTKLKCCYDPIMKTSEGRVAPHCYKEAEAPSTYVVSSTTATGTTHTPYKVWSGINPAFQPGRTPGLNSNSGGGPNIQKLMDNLPHMFNNPMSINRPSNNLENLFGNTGFNSGKVLQSNAVTPAYNPINILPSAIPPTTGSSSTKNRLKLIMSLLQSRKNKNSTPDVSKILSLLSQSKGTSAPPAPASMPGFNRPSSSNSVSTLLNLLLDKNRALSNGNIASNSQNSYQFSSNPDASQESGSRFSKYLSLLNGQTSGTARNPSVQQILKYLLKRKKQNVDSNNDSLGSKGDHLKTLSNHIKNSSPAKFLRNLTGNPPNPTDVGLTSASDDDSSSFEVNSKVRSYPDPIHENMNLPATVIDSVDALTLELNRIPIAFESRSYKMPRKVCYPTDDCGRRATDGSAIRRIVGGQWAGGIEFWPWTASLRRTFRDDDRYIHICGAILISKQWIVTAGHCFMAYERRGHKNLGHKEEFTSVYVVHLGQYQRDAVEPTMQIYELESFHTHPQYNFKNLMNDIAVAKLKEPVHYTNYVQPACLPNKEDLLFPGERSWVTGWGNTLHVGSQNKSKLKELTLPLIPTSECKKSWPDHFQDAWICTAGAYLEDACAGDSGGPLVMEYKEKGWHLIGVTIAGTRSCSTKVDDVKPGIYMKVAYYRDFIDSATQGACEILPHSVE